MNSAFYLVIKEDIMMLNPGQSLESKGVKIEIESKNKPNRQNPKQSCYGNQNESLIRESIFKGGEDIETKLHVLWQPIFFNSGNHQSDINKMTLTE